MFMLPGHMFEYRLRRMRSCRQQRIVHTYTEFRELAKQRYTLTLLVKNNWRAGKE